MKSDIFSFVKALEVPEFGVEVRFDGDHIDQVLLTEDHQGKVCGLCGNYNGVGADDWIVSDSCKNLGVQPGTIVSIRLDFLSFVGLLWWIIYLILLYKEHKRKVPQA